MIERRVTRQMMIDDMPRHVDIRSYFAWLGLDMSREITTWEDPETMTWIVRGHPGVIDAEYAVLEEQPPLLSWKGST